MQRSPRLASLLGLALVGCVLLTAACSNGAGAVTSSKAATSTAPTTPKAPAAVTASAATSKPRFAHVMVVVLENHASSQIVGNRNAPYLNSLMKHGLVLANATGVTHPSEPNYLALFAGSTFGVSSDSCPLTFSGPNLASELTAAHLSFAGYSEGLPRTGYTGCSAGDGYARKHNPWVDFAALPASINKPFSALGKNFGTLPTVSFVVPNLDDDMHDGTIAESDTWLSHHLAGYAKWAATHQSLLIVTWDEAYDSTNHIPMIVYGDGIKPGTSSQRVTHYSLLRSIEDIYRLPRLRAAARTAPIAQLTASST